MLRVKQEKGQDHALSKYGLGLTHSHLNYPQPPLVQLVMSSVFTDIKLVPGREIFQTIPD